jgi:FtsH-binding integral membrane protein
MGDSEGFLQNEVWERSGTSTMSRQLYLLMVCFWTAVGVVFSAIAASFSQDWPIDDWGSWGYLGFAVGVLAVALIGVYVAYRSDSPAVSLFGYALVAGPFGLLLGPFVAMYETSSIVKVFALTAMIVLVLGLIGAIIPDDLSSWGVPLLGALLLLIGGYFIIPILGFFGIPVTGAMTALDWVALIVFGALVLFDLNRAVRIPYTMDNAIDSAVAIYLDFINIFIRILRLMGKKK